MNNKNKWINIWNSFDAIYCINLIHRNDRLKDMKKIFAKYHIPIIFYRPEKHPNGGVQGCFESHINIMKDAYNKNYNKILIFEDDLLPTGRLTIKNMNKCINFTNKNKDWDILFLGSAWEENIKSTNFDNIYNAKCLLTHSYIASKKAINILSKLKFNNLAIDTLYQRNEFLNTFTFLPNIFHQKYSMSDIIVRNQNFYQSFLYKEYKTYYTLYSTIFYENKNCYIFKFITFILIIFVIFFEIRYKYF